MPIDGTLEADELHLSARRIRSKRGRGANGKTIGFGLPVYTEIVPNAYKATRCKPLSAAGSTLSTPTTGVATIG